MTTYDIPVRAKDAKNAARRALADFANREHPDDYDEPYVSAVVRLRK